MVDVKTVALSALILAAPAHADPHIDAQFHEISERIFRPIIETHDIPGIAIGLTLRGEQYIFTSGMADRDAGVAVDHDTLFELGSNSKLFNVALAALAEQRGLLSLQDPVAMHLPDLAGGAFEQISLGDLGAHATASLPLQVPEGITDTAGLMDYLADWQPEGEPRKLRSYSNVSIGLLGLITAQSFSESYEAALSTQLLPALGLEDTYVTVPADAMPHYAFGYTPKDNRPVRVNPGLLDAEAYGIKSNITDMTRFLDAQLGNLTLAPEVTAALARIRAADYDTAHYAQSMIWEAYPLPVSKLQLDAGNSSEMALAPHPLTLRKTSDVDRDHFFSKTGSTNGFGSYVAMIPSENIGLVVLTNRTYPNAVRAEAGLVLLQEMLAQSGE